MFSRREWCQYTRKQKRAALTRCHSLCKISSTAQVAPQRCPILQTSKSSFILPHDFSLSMQSDTDHGVQFRRRRCQIKSDVAVQRPAAEVPFFDAICKNEVIQQSKCRLRRPPDASCSCISCCPTGFRLRAAAGRRPALGQNCHPENSPPHGCACEFPGSVAQ